jgi:hypothetical protein
MKLEKNNFYVIPILEKDELLGYDESGEKKLSKSVDLIYYHNKEEMETTIKCRPCTQLEKEYWLDSMEFADEEIPEHDFGAVTLCDFEDWKKQKGYID